MLCKNCGENIPENTTTCPNCGTTFPTVEEPTVAPRGFSAKKNIIIILLAAFLVLGVGTAVTAFAVTRSPSYQVSHGLKLAERFLSEQNYEQAVIEFRNVIGIEPKNVDAYLGLADAYIGLGDTDKAIEVLRDGLERTNDAKLQAKLDALIKTPITDEPANQPASGSTSSSAASTPGETAPNTEYELGSEPYRRREYEENRLLFEEIIDADGFLTTTEYGYRHDPFTGEETEWGVLDVYKHILTEDGEALPIFDTDYSCGDEITTEYTYDDQFNEIRRVQNIMNYITSDNGDGEKQRSQDISNFSYQYGPYGPISCTETNTYTYFSDGYTVISTYFISYTYSADGKLKTKTRTSSDGRITDVTEYEADGKSYTGTSYYSNGEESYKIILKYDEKGRMIYDYHWNSYGNRESKINIREYSRTFDANGKLVKLTQLFENYQDGVLNSSDNNTWEYGSAVDEQGRSIAKFYKNGVYSSYLVTEYDSQGRPAAEIEYDLNGAPTGNYETYEYGNF